MGNFLEPAVGTPLGVRFYDGMSVATSAFYNTAVNHDGSGDWVAPSEMGSVINFHISKETSQSEGGLFGAFGTQIPVPEPGTSILLLGGLSLLVTRRIRNWRALRQ